MNIKLSKPVLIGDKETTEINLDFDSLNGQQIIDASSEARAMGDRMQILELSKTYQAVIAAKASGISVETIINLPAKDFVKITNVAGNFLLD